MDAATIQNEVIQGLKRLLNNTNLSWQERKEILEAIGIEAERLSRIERAKLAVPPTTVHHHYTGLPYTYTAPQPLWGNGVPISQHTFTLGEQTPTNGPARGVTFSLLDPSDPHG